MNFEEIYRDVRNKKFPEIKSKFISTNNFHFIHASPITGNIHHNPKNILAMKFSEKAVKGMIAHELSHQVDFRKRGFFGRVWLSYRCSRDEGYRGGFE